jgi:uroporphyrinogen decarboxylase
MMTCRQRVHASLRRAGFDALPWQFDLTSVAAERLARHWGVDAGQAHDALGDHILLFGNSEPVPADQTGVPAQAWRDEFGAIWGRGQIDRSMGDWGGLLSHPIAEPTLHGFRFPDGSAPGRWSYVPEFRRRYAEKFLVAGGHGLWEHGWALCGLQEYLEYSAGEPAFVQAVTEKLADFSCAVTAQLKGMDVDAIRFGDDWGFQDRLMMPPDTWRRLLKKQYRRIYAAARDAGLIVMIHSCGNITEILPDLIEIGVQVVNPLQPEAMDVEYCQREFGRDLSFWGGLGSQSTLPNGTPEDCRHEVRARLKLFERGGYILAPAGAVPTETPPENLAAVAETARAQLAGAAGRGSR